MPVTLLHVSQNNALNINFSCVAQADVEKFMKECGVSVDKDAIKQFFANMADKNVAETIKEGEKKLIKMPAVGGGGARPAAGGAAAAAAEPAVAVAKKRTRKKRRINVSSDEESDDEDFVGGVEEEDDEEDEGVEGEDGGWAVVEILAERWVLGQEGASRQYELLYDKYYLPKSEKWRDADAQDRDDMPPAVLAKWRAEHPPAGVAWVKGHKKVTTHVLNQAKAEYVAALN